MNLDPAADRFDYPVSLDIKTLIDVEARRSSARRWSAHSPSAVLCAVRQTRPSTLSADCDGGDGARAERRSPLQYGVLGAARAAASSSATSSQLWVAAGKHA